MFAKALQDTLKNDEKTNVGITENGMVGHRTSGKALLDLNFRVASLRNATNEEIINLFKKALYENKLYAIKWLYFARDCRQGLGERKLFRVIAKHLCENQPCIMKELLRYVPYYGRWDDLWELLDTPLGSKVMRLVEHELAASKLQLECGQPISLLAKWLPSTNTSSQKTKQLAHRIRKHLGMNEKAYRQMLSRMREHLRIVERDMSANNWGAINYETVPSRANLLYSNAFMRHDGERRRGFLNALERGEAKINSSVLFPHDIVHKYLGGNCYERGLKPHDQTLEGLWKNLPVITGCLENTIVVADGSGSMTSTVGGSNVTALSVANALAIYFSERSSGQFKHKYITFSERPQLVDFSQCETLREKIEVAQMHDEVADTNIEAVFDLILRTATAKKMSQSELPANIMIVSDMEFNGCATANRGNEIGARLFANISERYCAAGYKLPRLIFWNVSSRTNTVPVIENELGIALVSGFSVNIVNMVLSGNLDAYECLIEQLLSERYAPITINTIQKMEV